MNLACCSASLDFSQSPFREVVVTQGGPSDKQNDQRERAEQPREDTGTSLIITTLAGWLLLRNAHALLPGDTGALGVGGAVTWGISSADPTSCLDLLRVRLSWERFRGQTWPCLGGYPGAGTLIWRDSQSFQLSGGSQGACLGNVVPFIS